MTVALVLALGLGLAYSAQAGLFGLDVFAAEDAVKEDIRNSQNLPILQASPSPLLASKDNKVEAEVKLDGAALLPESGPLGTAADVAQNDYTSDQISLYVVKKGDTVASISKLFNVSQNTIIWANDLKRGQSLKEDQTLIIMPITGVQYTVKKGDTLSSIVKKYKGDLDEVRHWNDLSGDAKLSEGDIVFIPDGEFSEPVVRSSSRKERLLGISGQEYAGYYIRPLALGVGHKSRSGDGLHGRNGIDLAAPRGTPILATASGTVIVSDNNGYNGGYGRYIVLAHTNSTQTLYAHMSGTVVTAGQSVAQGEIIGYVGSTGKSTGNHVHFEVRGAKNPGRDNSWANQ
ncbi:hypothetical protein A3I25_00540 [Candidatus Nomurabacteria bacterium RIFCSPLOWO2_02_FULL_42_17]|uniref:LysM domain-containing protein n=2 Tax=Candidatus Nomuraibacteriota TaxID=1752729 RepID=A0A1F6WHJ3_9BACT|nr:MAG: hypothetical protein A3B93_00185 [Candidatus Nomurabacteria bacterium RIFCSPHIGHO2_02_FULL_42_24]OGI96855.1 MAG: hypothetical protein A3I25_00540 [Candidatus Nomurabacteria bacterium RIFCSPLOWO2_02_FULL_42_17]